MKTDFMLPHRAGDSFALDAQRTNAFSAQAPSGPVAQTGPSAADIPGGRGTTVTATTGTMIYDTLEVVGDHDWIRIDLAAGQHITLLYDGFGANELVDPLIRLRDSTAAILASNDDIDPGVIRDSRLEFTAATAGTYYIDLGAYGNQYSGDYQLQVFDSTASSDAILASKLTTASMKFGGTFNGVIDTATDHDWVAVTLTAGQEYTVRISGDGGVSLGNPMLSVRNANGAIIATNDDTNGLDPEVTFTATTAGTYFFDVSGSGGSTGEYAIELREALRVYTLDEIAFQLTDTYWGDGSHAFAVGADNSLTFNVSAITVNQANLARAALQAWTDVTGIAFVETTGTAEITFKNTKSGAFATSTYDGTGTITSSIVNVSTNWVQNYGTSLDSYSFQTFIHEVGHALGLGHAGGYNGSANYPFDADYLNDCWSTTVMSYFAQSENTYFADQGFSYAYVTSAMMGDVVAMADLYGLSTSTRLGATTYGFNSTAGNAVYDATQYADTAYCIVDSGGRDKLDYSGFAQAQVIDLRAGKFMNIGGLVGNVSIGRGTVIEDAVGGAGNDQITGNNSANSLSGGSGKDILKGLNGNDTLSGDIGDDNLDGGEGTDTLLGGTGNDFLNGRGGADILRGGDQNDKLWGSTGNDELDGGNGIDLLVGGLGQDTLSGGFGADLFRFDVAAGNGNADAITDFEHLIDHIQLSRSVFSALSSGAGLTGGEFQINGAAIDASDRIIYDDKAGAVYYDADGTGATAQVLIATVEIGTVLSAADFSIFG